MHLLALGCPGSGRLLIRGGLRGRQHGGQGGGAGVQALGLLAGGGGPLRPVRPDGLQPRRHLAAHPPLRLQRGAAPAVAFHLFGLTPATRCSRPSNFVLG